MTRTARSMSSRPCVPVGAARGRRCVLVAGLHRRLGLRTAPRKAAAEADAAPGHRDHAPPRTRPVAPTSKVVVKADEGHARGRRGQGRATARVVPGTLYEADTVWRSDDKLLQFGSTYTVDGHRRSTAPAKTTATSTFTVKRDQGPARAASRRDSRTVGVGMPITVTLSAAPARTAPRSSSASPSPRPSRSPAPGTGSATRRAALAPEGLLAGEHRRRRSRPSSRASSSARTSTATTTPIATFQHRRRQVSTVDVAGHTMTVTTNGQVVRTIPITTGKPASRPAPASR